MIRIFFSFLSILLLQNFFPLQNTHAEESSSENQVYIVEFKDTIDTELIQDYNGVVKTTLKNLPIVSVIISKENAEMLSKEINVANVELDISVENSNTNIDTTYNYTQNYKDIFSNFNLNTTTYTGKGVNIAIIGDGIDIHEDFELSGGTNCEGAGYCIDGFHSATHGHESHVAGIISGKHNGKGQDGIAPNANLFSVKIAASSRFSDNYIVHLEDFLQGLDWVLGTHYDPTKSKIDIVNMSFEAPKSSIADSIIDLLIQENVLLVASAGNFGSETSPLENNVIYPASNDNVISVGSTVKLQDLNYYRLPNSSTGPKVDIVAPGYKITSSIPIEYDSDGVPDGYTTWDGTSMATPFVTGALAILKEMNPNSNSQEIKNMLFEKAIPIKGYTPLGYTHKKNWEYGYGFVQIPPKEREEELNLTDKIYNIYLTPNYADKTEELIGNGIYKSYQKWYDWHKIKDKNGEFVWINTEEGISSVLDGISNGIYKTDSKGWGSVYLNPDGTSDYDNIQAMGWFQEKPFVDYSYDYIKNNYDYKLSEEVYKYYRLMGLGDFYDKQTNEMINIRREFLQKYKKLSEYGYWYDDYEMDEHYEKDWVRYTRIDHTNVYNVILKDSNEKTYFIPIISSGLINFDVEKQTITPRTNAFVDINGRQSFKPILYWIKPNSNLTVFSPDGLEGGDSLLYATQIDNIEERKNIEFLKVIKQKLGRQDLELVEVLQ